MCSNTKHLTHDAVIARFDPYLYPLDVSYQNVNEVSLNALLCLYTCNLLHPIYVVIHYKWHHANLLTGSSQKPLDALCV